MARLTRGEWGTTAYDLNRITDGELSVLLRGRAIDVYASDGLEKLGSMINAWDRDDNPTEGCIACDDRQYGRSDEFRDSVRRMYERFMAANAHS